MDSIVRDLAKCIDFDFGIECHGCPVLLGHFDYEDGSSQSLGYVINVDFLTKFLRVFDVESLKRVNNKSCWVTHDSSKIYKIEPLHKKDGTTFDIESWSKTLKAKSK